MSMSSSKGSDDHPPPVIALSRSSGSTGSTSSAESALETTEVDRHHDDQYDHGHGHGHGHKKKRHMRQRRYKKYHDETAYAIPNPSSQNHDQNHPEDDCNEQDHNGVDYAVRHELLINALFEDARHRQELQAAGGTSPLTPTSPTSHTMATTPPRKNSVASVSKSITSTTRSTTSRRSNTSSGSNSDILCPSAHQFKKTLTSKRKIQITALSALKRKRKCNRNRNRANSFSSISKTGSNRNRATSFSSTSKTSSGKPPLDESSIASLTTGVGDHAQSFLHSQCLLQKDSGKGVDPGTGVNAHGREDAMAKLVEKMDLLGQVATDSESGAEKQFGTVNLTRVPAKNMTLARREVLFDKGTGVGVGESYADSERGFVETRSMLAVKMDKFGFMSMKYGFLVHWNKATGLAELIVLRKMCSDSFMKVKSTKKSKSWRKRMRRMSISADADMLHMRGTTPSMISVDLTLSNDTSYDDLKAVQTDPY